MKPKTKPFDLAEQLRDDDDIATYLTLVIEDALPRSRRRGRHDAGQGSLTVTPHQIQQTRA